VRPESRWGEFRSLARHQEQLLSHLEPAAEEVDPVESETEGFSLAQPCTCTDQDEGPVPRLDRVGEREDLCGFERDDSRPFRPRELDALAGAPGDDPVGDGAAEDAREVAVDHDDGGRCELLRSLLHPGLKLARSDGPDAAITEVRRT
jgi:hypothetical protein